MNGRIDPRELVIDKRELYARLGSPLDSDIEGFDRLYEMLLSVAKPAYTAAYVSLSRQKENIILGNAKINSRALQEVCRESEECVLLAATLGIGVDRLILKTASISARDAFIIDAVSDALIESLCDRAEETVCEGKEHSSRFSPGYADLALSVGEEILKITDAERTLGIKLSASGLMIPKKSVNAIIAIKSRDTK